MCHRGECLGHPMNRYLRFTDTPKYKVSCLGSRLRADDHGFRAAGIACVGACSMCQHVKLALVKGVTTCYLVLRVRFGVLLK